MSLTIELSAEQEARLFAAARQRGVAPAELAQELLAEELPRLGAANLERQGGGERDPKLLDQVRSLRGKYARFGVTADELHHERQADREREER